MPGGPDVFALRRRARTSSFRGFLLLCWVLTACSTSPSVTAYTATPVPTAAVADYLQRYVTALNNRDTSAVAALLNNPGQPQDAADRMAAYGGRGLTIVSVELLPEEFPGIVRADVSCEIHVAPSSRARKGWRCDPESSSWGR